MKSTIRLINDSTSMALISRKSIAYKYNEILDNIIRHPKTYDIKENRVNIKFKIDGSVLDMENVIYEIKRD